MVHARIPLAGLVFDMDGTLIESHAAVPAAYRAAVVAGGGRPPSDEEVIAGYPLGAPEHLLAALLRRPATRVDLDRYHDELARAADRVTVYDGVADLLAEVGRRLPVGVFTGASARAARILLDRTGLAAHVRVIVGGDQVARPKPDPEGVLLACRRLGVEPARVAYVGDSPLDLGAARAAGALSVAAAWGHLYDPGVAADLVAGRPGDLVALVR
ncbi:HAD-IA family hydrolase [Micromonospora sp. WMMD1128]|uniref:HAD family hydrolase n=1 Tax=unclassified Micromonospora TaxID=2617518 RepID=UPI00248D01CD|nr:MULTISPECIES: HAD-IA family hydrolase [unclassified Micromonospora]WBB76499.1 HAD-IA family hydrolase [Micromonospora sp. WMMD1128]WFE35716.1 HAD-IA family hydrolase [Micromonospora sp. WMMD975]